MGKCVRILEPETSPQEPVRNLLNRRKRELNRWLKKAEPAEPLAARRNDSRLAKRQVVSENGSRFVLDDLSYTLSSSVGRVADA